MSDTVYPVVIFNSIYLNDGVNTWLLSGTTQGERTPAYEEIRSYSGVIAVRDVHDVLVTMSLSMRMMFDLAAGLEDAVLDLRAACLAGGSLSWQDGASAVSETFTIAPSPEPQIPRTQAYVMRHRAQFTLNLKRWP